MGNNEQGIPRISSESVFHVPVLPLSRYRLRFKTSGDLRLPRYAGSALRGALGHALKKVVCVTNLGACASCLLYRSCPYPYVFETPPPVNAAKMRKYTAAPHPFVIEPGPEAHDGIYEVGLTLIGRANQFLPYAIHAFQRAGEQGIGPGRGPLTLDSVSQAEPVTSDAWSLIYQAGERCEQRSSFAPVAPSAPSSVRLNLETPLRLQRDGKLVTPASFRFRDLFGALVRRISMLTYFHTDTPLETDFPGLRDLAQVLEATAVSLTWRDWTRYSSRQKTTIEMGGLVGQVSLDLDRESPLWPYLWLGQWVHAGRGTSMGLGRYTLETASLPIR